MRVGARVCVVAVAALSAACSDGDDSNEGRLIVLARNEGQMGALIEGEIVVDVDGCTLIRSGGRVLGLVWPFETTWQPEPAAVVLADGTRIVSEMTIRSAGGAQSVDHLRAYPDDLLGPDRLTAERLACADDWWVLGGIDEIEILN